MRVRRLFLLAFFTYVVLDLSCPLVPGAFRFDPADSVDAVSAHRLRAPAVPRVASVPPAVAPAPGPAHTALHGVAAPTMLSPVSWRPHADRDHTLAADPRPSVEDD